jgi:phosphonatase-like hydrolase
MEIDLVVFDVAGTTVEDEDVVASTFRSALGEVRPPPTQEEIERVMGLAKPHAIRLLLTGEASRRVDEEIVDRVHALFTQRMIHHFLTSPHVRPIAGAETTFAILRASGVRVALDTGFGRPVLDALLLRLGWHQGEVVDVTVTSDEVARSRPHPDMILRAMQLCGCEDPRRVVKVGDTAADMGEGVAAGCGAVIGVARSPASAVALRRAGATGVVRSVADVPAVLARLGALAAEAEPPAHAAG